MALIIRKGSIADAERFIRFLDEIKLGMHHKEWLYLDPPEEVLKMMSDGIMELWIAMDGDRTAAVFSIIHPGLAGYNYGYDLGLSKEELLRVVHMDTAAVHPDYRGLGLQGRMIRIAEEQLSGPEKKILLCTVHPENRFSLKNMLIHGYQIQMRLNKYGSERFILRKDIF